MIKGKYFKGMVIGSILTVFCFTTVSAIAGPVYKQITASIGGIKIVVDGETIIAKDANGKTVEPLIYNGTTYLPVRAVTQALTKGMKNVEWDQQNWTVYIGEKQPTGKLVKINELKPASGDYYYRSEGFEVRQNKYTPFNDLRTSPYTDGSGYYQRWNHDKVESPKYLLAGKYEKLTGYLAIGDTYSWESSDTYYGTLKVYANDAVNGEFSLIYTSPRIQYMKEPIAIEVPLAGVDRMYFTLEADDHYMSHPCHFFNIELMEINK